ncbi:membrane protein implicated in regulation of membrane protease activity [Paenibacillus shirakamiensis]|uniref:Membrane protein implicated in regulation of membrane protease activity n=1 Tax=Paenibacillus shirakamiensis TaxID=1265935 RepID=A0ABS4JD65_9BACL|nr:protease [Paenibacillus shirakamiensis]MBP1999051.1 membrane protein implicated in regulation of membrane protease activity [Paenibacillus shirakamiensis]
MEALYWGCLIGGVMFALVSVLVGDVISDVLGGLLDFLSLDILKPMILAGSITGFGGAGILFHKYFNMSWGVEFILSMLIAVALGILVYYSYVKPMENSENSSGYSNTDLPGKIGEVTIPLPAIGYGEVMITMISGNTLHIASSCDQTAIMVGSRVVVVDVKEGVVQVAAF